jgi:hypothetical protein
VRAPRPKFEARLGVVRIGRKGSPGLWQVEVGKNLGLKGGGLKLLVQVNLKSLRSCVVQDAAARRVLVPVIMEEGWQVRFGARPISQMLPRIVNVVSVSFAVSEGSTMTNEPWWRPRFLNEPFGRSR